VILEVISSSRFVLWKIDADLNFGSLSIVKIKEKFSNQNGR
jgi:hypothetical protein